MAEALLSVQNLRVQYGRLLAVDDVSFELAAGELLGMIGPNGAGKTTTLRAAAGLQPISTGSVRILGTDVFARPTEACHSLGFCGDTPALYDMLTVEQFLEFIGKCYRLPKNLLAERIDHWLEMLWLAEKKTAKVGSLSRGMKQRLGVARTLLPDPHVVLLDEPAAGLDPAGRVQFRTLLANLRDQGKAIIVSSHILADLAEYCTHIAIMGHGRLIRFGPVSEVAGGDQARWKYHVTLAQRVGDLEQRLASVAALQTADRVVCDGDRITLEYDRERLAAASLLREMVLAGLPVAEFRAAPPDLEQAYLRTGIRQVD